ncbi:MAG: peptidoglycan binding domain-containing protein [Anaerolineae bacterium]|nr:peptidoglycan binding domain-containing protein [Anaerolineae bacterium]
MNEQVTRRHHVSSARQRQIARERKREAMVKRRPVPDITKFERTIWFVQDRLWYIQRNPTIAKALLAVPVTALFLYIAAHLLAGRIFPNIWVVGIYIGDMTVDEAATALRDAWYDDLRIQLVDEDRTWTASPSQLGLSLDARQTAQSALGIGLSGIPFGNGVPPVVEVDYLTAQEYLLTISEEVSFAPVNAGYKWEGDALVGVPGRDGRMLDVGATLELLTQGPVEIAQRLRLQLVTNRVEPDMVDPIPYLEDARQLANQPFAMRGYDPFTNEFIDWRTDRDTFTSWLEVRHDGLTLREETFAPFLEALNTALNESRDQQEKELYLDRAKVMQEIQEAFRSRRSNVQFRIRHRPTVYTVAAGDTAYGIARKTGLPFFLIEENNPGRDLSQLSPGDTLSIPSRDATVPLDPVASKRIIVNLDTQSMVAYENGVEVFNWRISSGITSAPTSPGIYQIFSHEPVAYGSSYTLCGETGCGQWEMNWFMGIYEVVPGLVNGFHGAVLLPDGTYLGGNSVGTPYTLGCVMSRDDEAKVLYDWADEGTIVEIISDEFSPESDLGRQTLGGQV